MSEHEKHTEFLRHCLLYDESAGREELMKEIARIQRDLRCVQRAAWLMAMLGVLLLAVLGYGTILVANFPYNTPQFVINLIIAVVVGMLISFLTFVGLWIVYRWKLDLRREECRQMVAKLLESRLGKPAGKDNTHRLDKLIETAQESSTGGITQESKS
jgi:uncharacterized membrane protein YccC